MADPASRAGARYGTAAVVAYVDRVHAPHDADLDRAFLIPDGMPSIQVSRSDGATLELLIRLVHATKVVEIGTLAGYSALRIARVLRPGGKVWTIESAPDHADVARANIAAAGLAGRVEVLVGAAVDILPTLVGDGPFDAVFIDADKANYALYGRWAVTNLRPGGLVIGDNSYLFGELVDDTLTASSVRAFHEHVAATCDSACLPTPDGMVVGIKR